MAVAALLCFCLYQHFQWTQGFWSVVTVSAIARPNLSDIFTKAFLRLSGTISGAFVGFLCAYSMSDNPYWLAFAFFIVSTATAYIATQMKPYNYGAIVAGFTTAIIIASKVEGQVQAIALYRSLEVILGILVMALVSAMTLYFIKDKASVYNRQMPSDIKTLFQHIHYSRQNLATALRVSASASLSLLAWLIFRYPYGIWMTITILIIMEETTAQTREKSKIRFSGQVLAALYGLIVVYFADANLYVIAGALVFGYFVSGLIIGSGLKIADMGNHAGSAIAIMLLVDLGQDGFEVVIARFLNVLAGILIANLVMSIKIPGFKNCT